MPGRSMTSRRVWPISQWPVRRLVVVPGKFEVLARAPQNTLKSVVLPVFGFPSRATRGYVPAVPRSGVGAVTGMWPVQVEFRDDEDGLGDAAGHADPGGPYLDDERLAALADTHPRRVGEPERPQQ